MAVAAPLLAAADASDPVERRLVLHGVSFREYVALSDLFVDRPALHLTFLEGTLEIMTTSPRQEKLKTLIARLVEIYPLERDVRLVGIGSATFRREEAQRGLEPDECYCVGDEKPIPDLAIEVVVSHPDVDKLAVYHGLGVREVWVWVDDAMVVHERGDSRYVRREGSALLPDLDLGQLSAHVRMPDQADAVRAYRDALRAETAP